MPPRHTLLVVDDEPDVVLSVQALLRRDFRVLAATSAAEGMRLLAAHEVHVVMTDQRMPEMTGVEFLSRIRGEHPNAVRLLFTGYADIKAVIEAINQGNVFRYIAKPWDPDELRTVIQQAADHYELLAEREALVGELQANNARLREAGELKAAFIQVASHELRTPLTIVLGLSELAQRAAPGDPRLPDWLLRIERGTQRLQRLVDQMSKLLEAGRFDRLLARRPTDLAALLHEAADDVRPFVERRRQRLACEPAAGLGQASVDPEKIRDLLGHLLLNAIKFTPDGGAIRLSAERAADGAVVLRVVDDGPGIGPASLPHMFQPFFTGFDVSRHHSGQFEHGCHGLGLGLTIVKSFAEMHGGTAEARSEPGQGATFVVTLPADPG